MGLTAYKSRRKFDETPEPGPSLGHRGERLAFVVHKHAARTLHYDLRLEMAGVLKSWAVPKGPPMAPSAKRLAVMVEDHPLDYEDFEGVIPEGNYGAGSVIVWDRGFYHHPSTEDAQESEKLLLEGLRRGDIKLMLSGERLHGEFALVRTRMGENTWLLLKKKDQYATGDDVLKENRSVVSGRTLEDLAEAGLKKSFRKKKINQIRIREVMEGDELKDAPLAPMPHRIRPMLASLAKEPFDHPDWLFEVKWDGYRTVAEIRDGDVSLFSRNLLPLNRKFAPVVEELEKVRFEAVLDGEIVVVDDEGRPDFQMLQNYPKSRGGHLVYYVFDLPYFQGHDLTNLSLIRRKGLLKKILPASATVKFSDHVLQEGRMFFNAAREKKLEGIVAKHKQSPYRTGQRSRQWLKVKTHLTQDAVIAGFTEPRGSRRHFGSLVLGVYEGGELVCIGSSGGGFAAKGLKEIRERLEPLIQQECPFKTEPETGTRVTWVKPEIVCEVAFSEWTEEGVLRQPVFMRLREDKDARDVMREKELEP